MRAQADTLGSGLLNQEQLEAALTSAGLKYTRHQAINLRRRLDKEKSGSVAVEDLLHWLGIK